MATNTPNTSKENIDHLKSIFEKCSSVVTDSINTLEGLKQRHTTAENKKYSEIFNHMISKQKNMRKDIFGLYNSIDKETNIISHDKLMDQKVIEQEKIIEDLLIQNQALQTQIDIFSSSDIIQKYQSDIKMYNDKIDKLNMEVTELTKKTQEYETKIKEMSEKNSYMNNSDYIMNIIEQVINVRQSINKNITIIRAKHIELVGSLAKSVNQLDSWSVITAQFNISMNEIASCVQQQYIIETLLKRILQNKSPSPSNSMSEKSNVPRQATNPGVFQQIRHQQQMQQEQEQHLLLQQIRQQQMLHLRQQQEQLHQQLLQQNAVKNVVHTPPTRDKTISMTEFQQMKQQMAKWSEIMSRIENKDNTKHPPVSAETSKHSTDTTEIEMRHIQFKKAKLSTQNNMTSSTTCEEEPDETEL